MFAAWITLSLLLPGAGSFLIHNKLHSRCLEDSATSGGPVLLRRCSLDTDRQQWVWRDRQVLECVATSRCLSAHHTDPVRTVSCEGQQGDALLWDCGRGRLISQNRSGLELSADSDRRLTLSHHGSSTRSQWRSLDQGDICQDSLRSKRASSDPDEFEVKGAGPGEHRAGPAAMTEEQREFLRWYYRTEDSTPWLFAMLVLSFACLLVGFLLLGMGSMASKSRRKIAKYKAVASMTMRQPEAEALQVVTEEDTSFSSPSQARSPVTRQVEGGAKQTNGEVEGLRPGGITVTWKNGHVSTLYSEPAPEPEEEEEEEERGEEGEGGEEGEREEEEGERGEEGGERGEEGEREEEEGERGVEGEEVVEGEREEEGEEVVVAAAEEAVQTGGGAPEEERR